MARFGLALGFVFALGLTAPVSATAAAPSSASHSCYGVHGRLVCNGQSYNPRGTYRCLYISRQTLEAVAWGEIAKGGFFSGAGLLADGTVLGIPLGAVLGLVGIGEGAGGSFLLWYADTYYRPGWKCGRV